MIQKSLFFSLLFSVVACEGDEEKESIYADADGDGFSEVSDCNDNDASINLNADDICDGIDNDCSGEIDDNATDATTWYPDADGDGVGDAGYPTTACEAPEGYIATAGDCDDNNPEASDTTNDADCDGVATADDCDDTDGQSTSIAEDGDCDGVVTADDCDDADATSTIIADDADCDGTITADDCDDSDNASTIIADDADCDGVLTADDCDDTDATSTTVATDGDCDTVLTADDCDDTDATSTTVATDADCDGTITADDCDDADATSTIIADDADCDGTITDDDCDDSDNASTIVATDADCDGTLTADDCDDTDDSSTTIATDADCDTVLTADDCDDNNAFAYPGIFTMSNTDEWSNYGGWTYDSTGLCEAYCQNPCSQFGSPYDTGVECSGCLDDGTNQCFPGSDGYYHETEWSLVCMSDVDGDGYGDSNATGDVTPGLDCDDSDATSTNILTDADCDGTVD